MRRRLLQAFGHLPRPVRRFVIRRAAPSWTAGAVAILERDDGRWLMVSPVYRNGWSLPGGLIDRGEDPASAVIREFAEELGITIAVIGDPWIVYDSTMRRIDAIFHAELVDDVDPDGIRVQSPELDGVGWFEPTAPPALEVEAEDALTLHHAVMSGGPTVLWR